MGVIGKSYGSFLTQLRYLSFMDYREILNFWFDPKKSTEERLHLWFGGTPEIDDEIRRRFEPQVLAASRGEFESWRKEPESCLALLILLDQFSLNIYRDQARSFQINDLGLPIALQAIDQGFDQKVGPFERVFYYLPLEHAEDVGIQERSVALFKRLLGEARPENRKAMEIFFDYAVKHKVVIDQFGRYPDRNAILGRKHTPEEAAYMAAGGPPF